MFSSKIAEEMAKQFVASLGGLNTLKQEVEAPLYQFLIDWFNKMELVTREEFDIQAQVLAKTRSKVEALEAALKSLEEKLS